jgi:hypothetical protein
MVLPICQNSGEEKMIQPGRALTLSMVLAIGFFTFNICMAGGFDAPFDVNPVYETVYIKHRAEEGILGVEGWSLQGNTLYGYFDDDNIAGLPASEIGSITLDGSLGVSNVQIAVDLRDMHDFNELNCGDEPLRIGSVTNIGGTLDSVTTIVNVEGPIRY